MSYPIKYAVEDLKVDGGIIHDYEDITKGYIVSKCYVLENRLNYRDDCISYVVSFPYDSFDIFVSWYKRNSHNYYFDIYKHYYEQRRDPNRELLRDGYPRHIVTELFDTYEEAKEVADRKNGCLKGEILTNTGSAAYEKLSEEFKDTMEICGEYEKFVFANTTDMEVSLIESEYTYSKDSVVLAKLLQEFEYDPVKRQEILYKYELLTKKYKNLTLDEKRKLTEQRVQIAEVQNQFLKKLKK